MAKPKSDHKSNVDEDRHGYASSGMPEDGHIQFRKCAVCGCQEMKPTSSFKGTTIGSAGEQGLVYDCPECGKQVKISDSSALVTGVFYSLFWGAVGLWAFHSGPYWYLIHLGYFSADNLSFLLFDIVAILFYLAVIGFSGWIIWTFLIGPVKTLAQHPVTKENRMQSHAEVEDVQKSRRSALVSFFLYPLFLWAVLLGVFWALDAAGFDLRENEFIAYTGFGVMLAIGGMVAKRTGLNFTLAFFGMILWLAILITAIFNFA